MSIAVVTCWHNEAMMAPHFLGHYSYADKIHIIMCEDTDDDSRDICGRYPNVEIEEFTMPLMNDIIKAEKMSDVVSGQKADWAYAVDADELIFPLGGEEPGVVLGRQFGSVMYAKMWNVYRHRTDKDLDPNEPAVYQRRHGNPSFATPGAYATAYVKPIIVRPGIGVKWYPGNHMCRHNPEIVVCDESFTGAHWRMADEKMAITRRIAGMRDRMSQTNLDYGLGEQDFHITEQDIGDECKKHLDDPRLF